jgi:hypothetical protein
MPAFPSPPSPPPLVSPAEEGGAGYGAVRGVSRWLGSAEGVAVGLKLLLGAPLGLAGAASPLDSRMYCSASCSAFVAPVARFVRRVK